MKNAIPNNLERILRERDITVYKLSKDTGITYRIVHGYKKGKNIPLYPRMKIIAEYLKVNIQDIWE